MNQITPVVKQLLIVNVIIFIGTMFIPALMDYFPMYYFENPSFEFWQPLTRMFLHAGFFHVLFSLLVLYSFGAVLEQIWGGAKFIIFYFACGLGACIVDSIFKYFLIHNTVDVLVLNGFSESSIFDLLGKGMFDNRWAEFVSNEKLQNMLLAYMSVSFGSTGIIYGLMVAFAFMFPNTSLSLFFIPVPIKAKYFVPIILILDLAFGFFGGASIFGNGIINYFAHIGGALVGFLLMWFWRKKQFDQFRWDK